MKKVLVKNKLSFLAIILLMVGFSVISCNDNQEVDINGQENFIEVNSEMVSLLKTVTTKSDVGFECVEFQYPVVFYYILPTSTNIETAIINSDEDFIDFFNFLEEVDSIRIDFPVTLLSTDDEKIVINDMETLIQTLQTAVEVCLGIGDFEFCDSSNKKVYVCHNGNTLCISASAVQAHLAHGDVLGQCD